jgi:hypothetical protein
MKKLYFYMRRIDDGSWEIVDRNSGAVVETFGTMAEAKAYLHQPADE